MVLTRLTALVIALLVPHSSLALDCDPAPVDRALVESDLVFAGLVTSVRLGDPNHRDREPATIVDFKVLRAWKGPQGRTATVHTNRRPWLDEGYGFLVGEAYLVFALRNTPEVARMLRLRLDSRAFVVRSCGGTTSFRTPYTSNREHQLRALIETRK